MSEIIEYIDRYFKKELSESERLIFEKRCESDQAFADEVAFFISARALMEVEADMQQKKELDEIYTRQTSKKAGVVKKILPYFTIAAAACLILFFGWQFLFKASSAKQIAQEFIEKNIQNSATLMGNDNNKDSLAKGAILFYDKKYDEAERIFQSLVTQEKYGAEAIEYLGKVYLVKGKYEQALMQFEALSQDTSLRVNYGSFYKAVTLMRRDANGDVENAKKILNEVIRKGLAGSKEAKSWINKI
jgi:TolA-binding protein